MPAPALPSRRLTIQRSLQHSLQRSLRFALLVAASIIPARQLQAQGVPEFPRGWMGRWTGTLTTYGPPDSIRNRIPITLEIAREATGQAFQWRTVFNADTVRGLRAYRLLVRDSLRGQYATDEGNGLVLEETYIAGSLLSVFEVGGRVLESRYTLRADTLVHDITWWSATPSAATRGEGANSEGGAGVRSYRVQGRQRAIMTRVPALTP